MLTIEDVLKSDLVASGQEHLSREIEHMIAVEDASLLRKLSGVKPTPLLEPLLFAYFTTRRSPVPLRQLLYGHLEPRHRPNSLDVVVAPEGRVCLPGFGDYTCSADHGRTLLLRTEQDETRLFEGSQMVSSDFESPMYVPSTNIEVSRDHHPLLGRFFAIERESEAEGTGIPPEVVGPSFVGRISAALDAIGTHCPNYHEAILAVTRRLSIFRAEHGNSFAAVPAHGMAFLRVDEDPSEVFFIEDLLHQCGHIIFSAMTLDPSTFLRIEPDTSLGVLTGDGAESRSVYVTLHGVFTESLMTRCLDLCLDDSSFAERGLRHELIGRLAYIVLRFGIDLPSISRPEIFTDRGLQLLEAARRVLAETYERRGDLLHRVDLSNQPYAFSYERFVERNPPSG